MEQAVRERRKAFAAAHRNEKIARLTPPLSDVPGLSSPRLRNGRRLALLFNPNLTLNLCTLSFVLVLALLPHLLLLLTSPIALLPGSRLRSSPIT